MPSLPRSIPPAALLSELGIDTPEDIDIEAIAQHCGATIVYAPLVGCEARIIGYGERAIITINRASSPERKRFSAGHELGHWSNDRGKSILACTENQLSEWFADNPERRANRGRLPTCFCPHGCSCQEQKISRSPSLPLPVWQVSFEPASHLRQFGL